MYHIDQNAITLEALKRRIVTSDLVPSRTTLSNDIDSRFDTLRQHGCLTLGDLRKRLGRKKIPDFSEKTGIETEYLILLRREIESYFPRPFSVDAFDWIDESERAIFIASGLIDTRRIHEGLNPLKRKEIAGSGVPVETIETLASLADLTRIQWTSPTAARMLQAAGYPTAKTVASADPEALCQDLSMANERFDFFKGKIGLRDVRRLVKAASYLD